MSYYIKPIGYLESTSENYLWRFMDLHKLISFLTTQKIYFSRFDQFEDVNEGISKKQLFKQYKEHDSDYQSQVHNNRELEIEERQKRLFASCWFYGKRESVAMWNLYAQNDGIALRVKANSFIDSLTPENIQIEDPESVNTLYHGPVFYKDFLNFQDIEDFKDETRVIGFQKDLSFEHEKEYRIMIRQRYKEDNYDTYFNSYEIGLNNFNDLQFELLAHPKMQSWQKENVQKLIGKLNVQNFTFKDSELRLQ